MKLPKFFKDISVYFKRHKKEQDEVLIEQDEIDVDEADEKPGKVSLTDGEHGKAYTINNKIVKAGIIFIFVIIGLAFMYNLENSRQSSAPKKPNPVANQTASDPNRVIANDSSARATANDYSALAAANQRANGRPDMPNNAQRQQTQNQNNRSQVQYAQQNQPVQNPVTAPSVPYSFPYPTQTANIQNAAVQASSSDPEAERLRSAISFGLNSGLINNGSGSNPTSAPTDNTVAGATAVPVSTGASSSTATFYAPSNSVLQAGTIIPVMLYSGINTDAPGQVTALVESDVYDTSTETRLLIPAGSKILGSYSGNNSSSGRVDIKFNLIVTPDGGAISVGDSLVAIDGAGYNGVSGKINRHTERTLSAGAFSSALAAIGSYASGNTSTQNTYTGGQLAMQGAIANMMNTASNMFSKAADIQATVTVEPGYEFNVYVTTPIRFN